MIIDGRAIAKEVQAETKARAAKLATPPSFLAIVIAPSPATESYLKMKHAQAAEAGIKMEVKTLKHATTGELIELLGRVKEDAVIVQLPLPDSIDMRGVLDAIPREKDADCLSAYARREPLVLHPVAAAIAAVLKKASVRAAGRKATVVGRGWLVGSPAAEWLRANHAEVTVVTLDEGNLQQALKDASLVVSGAGAPGLITKDDVKKDAVIIDIGTSELGGSIAGDVDPGVAEVASVFTPVPGGVGPITVAYLLQNVVTLAEHARKLTDADKDVK